MAFRRRRTEWLKPAAEYKFTAMAGVEAYEQLTGAV